MLKDWKILYSWFATWQICNLSLVRSLRSSLVMHCRFSNPLLITPDSLRSSGRDSKGIRRSLIIRTGFSNPSTFCRQDYHSCCFKSDLLTKVVLWWFKVLRNTAVFESRWLKNFHSYIPKFISMNAIIS